MSHARRIGRALATGGKGTAVAGGSGVATFFLHTLAASKVSAVANNPILTPLAIIAAGHFAKRKMPTVGAGVIGAGGYALGLAIQARRMAASNAAASGQTSALVEPSQVAALLEPQNVGAYEIPDAAEDVGTVDYSSAMNL